MRLLALTCAVLLAYPTLAFDLGPELPPKPAVTTVPPPPASVRQGGDTILDAMVVSELPYQTTGTTTGFADDYDEACPYTGSTSPDVVYRVVAPSSRAVDIDMYGSTYDTKIYVYDEDLNLVDCNDDFYSDYVSKLEQVPLVGGLPYYIVIDGYGGSHGDYALHIYSYGDYYYVDCPTGAELEGEPPLVDGYVDTHNGGCNTDGVAPFGHITAENFCGVSGWYLSADGSQCRDTDWFELVVPPCGVIEISGDAESATYMFELGPQDCDNVGVLQSVMLDPVGTMTITGAAGDTVWFWVGPPHGDDEGEYNYVLRTSLGVVSTESQSWSTVKRLFR